MSVVLPSVRVQQALSTAEVAEITELVARAEETDGVSPLNDDARLALHHDGSATHLRASRDETLVGYAQLETGGEQPTAVLVVDPPERRAGIGRTLLEAVQTEAGSPVGFWSFRGLPAAAALARSVGLVAVRELLVMTADVTEPVSVPTLPEGVTIRPFEVGVDEEEWLALNARAFVHHPEQGRMTLDDLQEREAEDWFDPQGFLLAVRGGKVIGYHWTKQHPGRLGEVYVLGVDPDAGGRGLGKTLLAAGLQHLRDRGNTTVQLY
ncbi:MAG: mycothiol synthase, partial [Propionibacteriaceae bacterium]